MALFYCLPCSSSALERADDQPSAIFVPCVPGRWPFIPWAKRAATSFNEMGSSTVTLACGSDPPGAAAPVPCPIAQEGAAARMRLAAGRSGAALLSVGWAGIPDHWSAFAPRSPPDLSCQGGPWACRVSHSGGPRHLFLFVAVSVSFHAKPGCCCSPCIVDLKRINLHWPWGILSGVSRSGTR